MKLEQEISYLEILLSPVRYIPIIGGKPTQMGKFIKEYISALLLCL